MGTFYNTTDYPIVVDSGCRTVGGRERIVSEMTPEIELALKLGTMIPVRVVEKPKSVTGKEGK